MKFAVALLVVCCAGLSLGLAAQEMPMDEVDPNARPITEYPGFWIGKEHMKPTEETSLDRGSRITHGTIATPGQFPHMAFLQIATGSGTFICGGSLVRQNRVLTAAHCVDAGNINSILIILGAHNRNIVEATQVRVTVGAAARRIHPSYNSNTLVNDVAVLVMPSNVGLTARIQLLRLPSGAELSEAFANTASQLAGWGATETGATSPTLRFINHNTITNAACQTNWGGSVIASNICSATIGQRSGCGGDSGGPLTITRGGAPLQVGIVSFGTANCMQGWPSVYARYTSFNTWVLQQF